jgi:hypothetical protein
MLLLFGVGLTWVACGGRTTLDDTTLDGESPNPDGGVTIDSSLPCSKCLPDGAFMDVSTGQDSPVTVFDAGGPPPVIACGMTTCDALTEVCCVTFSGMAINETCTAPSGCMGGATLACTSASDCPTNEVCCGQLMGMSIDSTCAPSCMGGFANPQLCATSAECPMGQTCQPALFGLKTCRM